MFKIHNFNILNFCFKQEPTLFDGTIRSNLDPLNQFSDDVLWNSLEQVFTFFL